MQNSGEGNVINPIASLLDDKVYGISVIFIIGWRGQPRTKDEPQHIYQGEITLKLLEGMQVQSFVIQKDMTEEKKKELIVFEDLFQKQLPNSKEGKMLLWRMIDAICYCYKDNKDGQLTIFPYEPILDSSWYDEVVYLPFENIKLPAPKEYDKVLTATYGDYMKPVRFTSMHSYPCYGQLEEKLKEQILGLGFQGSIDEFCYQVSHGIFNI